MKNSSNMVLGLRLAGGMPAAIAFDSIGIECSSSNVQRHINFPSNGFIDGMLFINPVAVEVF